MMITSAAEGIGHCKRILVVDDQEDSAALVREYLEIFGSEVRIARDGATALRIAREFDPELALVDIGLPEMDGYELARRLREQTPERELRIVALTGYARDPQRERAESADFEAHMLKPFTGERLLKVLRDVCQRDPISH